jgi:hypothetical protein
MRPSVGQTGKVLGGALVVAVLYLGLRLIRMWQDPSQGPWFLALIAVTLGLVAAGYLLFFTRARIEADHERIIKVSAFGGRRSYPLRDVAGIAFRTVRIPSRYGYPTYGVVYGNDHRGLFAFSERLWDPNDIRRLASMLHSRDDETAAPTVSLRDFNREFPGAFNVWERHPYIFGIVVTVVIVIAAIGLISLKG